MGLEYMQSLPYILSPTELLSNTLSRFSDINDGGALCDNDNENDVDNEDGDDNFALLGLARNPVLQSQEIRQLPLSSPPSFSCNVIICQESQEIRPLHSDNL